MMTFRPSMLPKLAQCPVYEPDPSPGPAAERGTQLDACYRAELAGEPWPIVLPDPDIEAVMWAVRTTGIFAGGDPVMSDEESLRIEALGMGGTADAACLEKFCSFDLKSGHVRDYESQQAAYALGFMEECFALDWTVHLLYCDVRQVVTHHFSREDAERLCREIMASALDPLATAQPCEYCDWCAKRYRCAARLERVAWWIGRSPDEIDFEVELSDPIRLAQFLELCYLITKDDGLAELARGRARSMLQADIKVPGYRLGNRAGSQYVNALDVGRWIADLGFGDVLAAYGNLSADKLREIWKRKLPGQPFPEEIVHQGPGSQFTQRAPAKRISKASRKLEKTTTTSTT
jgi:hypothetical protein